MSTYRVHFEIRNPKNTGGTRQNTTVVADSDFMAVRLAESKMRASHHHFSGYSFGVTKIEKIKN